MIIIPLIIGIAIFLATMIYLFRTDHVTVIGDHNHFPNR